MRDDAWWDVRLLFATRKCIVVIGKDTGNTYITAASDYAEPYNFLTTHLTGKRTYFGND